MTSSKEKLDAVIRRSLAELNAQVVPRREFLSTEPAQETQQARGGFGPPGRNGRKRQGSDRVYGETDTSSDEGGSSRAGDGRSNGHEKRQEEPPPQDVPRQDHKDRREDGQEEPAASGPAGDELSEACVVQMDRLCRFFEESIEERCLHLRVSRNQEGHSRLLLTRRGLLVTADRIGKLVFFGPSDRGWEWAKERGIDQRFPGGLAHEIRLRRTILGMRQGIGGVRIERRGVFNGAQPDAVAFVGEHRIAVQICVSTPAGYELANLERLACDPAVNGIVFVASSGAAAAQMTGKLEKIRGDLGRGPGLFQNGDGRSTWTTTGLKKILVTTPEAVTQESFPWKALLKAFGFGTKPDRDDAC